ncbi:DUF1330 domain-containing protein [Actinobacillus ureae]|nr:DUF1330 domain-containing protein [Actinobacillus ureae]
MKKSLAVILLGITAFAQAESVKPAYVIGETEVLDIDKLQPYRTKMPETLKPYGGRFLARGAEPIMVEGQASKWRVVIIGFDNLALAKEWYGSVAYSAIRPIRQSSTNSRVMIVEGLPAETK